MSAAKVREFIVMSARFLQLVRIIVHDLLTLRLFQQNGDYERVQNFLARTSRNTVILTPQLNITKIMLKLKFLYKN